MVKNYIIPIALQSELCDRASKFSDQYLKKLGCYYMPDCRGKFIYLLRSTKYDSFEKVGRLTYKGDLENMDFAILKYSTGKYDADEMDFPGVSFLDGTIEGAMKACLKAYPV
jgi:hypothetical protein